MGGKRRNPFRFQFGNHFIHLLPCFGDFKIIGFENFLIVKDSAVKSGSAHAQYLSVDGGSGKSLFIDL